MHSAPCCQRVPVHDVCTPLQGASHAHWSAWAARCAAERACACICICTRLSDYWCMDYMGLPQLVRLVVIAHWTPPPGQSLGQMLTTHAVYLLRVAHPSPIAHTYVYAYRTGWHLGNWRCGRCPHVFWQVAQTQGCWHFGGPTRFTFVAFCRASAWPWPRQPVKPARMMRHPSTGLLR